MPDLTTLALGPSPISLVVDKIIARLSSVTDNNGVVVFPIVQQGLLFPEQLEFLNQDNVPAIFVWYDNTTYGNDGEEMVLTHRRATIQLFLYLYSFNLDGRGFPVDLQKKREEIIEFIFDKLQPTMLDNPDGFDPVANEQGVVWWRFAGAHESRVDHTAPFRKFGVTQQAKPPLYVSRIDLEIETVDEDQD